MTEYPAPRATASSRTATLPRSVLRALAILCTLLACALAPATATAQAARRVALLIGNQDYAHERKLRNPVNDATLLGRVLKDELKFDTVRVERNLDADAMDRVIDEFAAQARGAATVVFYYSGHGMTSPSDRRAYLLPTNARTGVPGAPRLERQAVAAELVRDKLRALGARITLIVLDACRDGPGDGKTGSKGLSRVGGGNQLLVAYATEEGKVAADGDGANSPYAEALARAWRQADLSVLQQLDAVYDEVTRRIPDQQPTREGNLRADALLANPFAAITPGNRDRIEDEAWALCRGAGSSGPCDDYLSGWPQGRYTALARMRLRDQQAQAQARREAAVPSVTSRLPGEGFKDCADCPEMVVVGAGSFIMGSPDNEDGRKQDGREGPQHRVDITQAFALGRYEVTVGEFSRFVAATHYTTDAERGIGKLGCYVFDEVERKAGSRAGNHWRNPGFEQADSHPVVCISWNDAQAYVQWLGKLTGLTYRLPSEAEWEYSARAGSSTGRPWGDKPDEACRFANGADQSRSPSNKSFAAPRHECNDGFFFTAPVGTYAANQFGLHDMMGNALEWVADPWHDNYNGAPTNGAVWATNGQQARGVLRGGAWVAGPLELRSAFRVGVELIGRFYQSGFRVARTL